MQVSKYVRTVLTMTLASVLAFVLVACGPKPENEIKKVIDSTFATLKNAGEEDITSYFETEKESFASYGVDLNEFLAHCFANLGYEVESVTVDESGEKATAEHSITNIALSDAVDAALDEFSAWTASDEALTVYQEGGESALFQKLFELIYAQMDARKETTVTNKATLSFTKTEEGWEAVAPTEDDAFVAALFGGMDPSTL